MKLTFILAVSALIFASHANAQSLSVADIQAKIDAEMSKGNEYAALLNDPDPARAKMAMEIMLESGDAKLRKMAIDFGFFSPSKEVRAVALKAVWDSKPKFSVTFDGTESDLEEFSQELSNPFGIRPGETGKAVYTRTIIGFDEDAECYNTPRSGYNGWCVLKIFGDGASFYNRHGDWYPLTFTAEGVLEGVIGLDDAQNIKVTIAVE